MLRQSRKENLTKLVRFLSALNFSSTACLLTPISIVLIFFNEETGS